MNRNKTERFENLPKIDRPRSLFDLSHRHITTMNDGYLYPILCKEILPGDTWSIDTSVVIKMNTPIKPVMDNLYADIYYFAVDNIDLWEHWEQFMGASDDEWIQATDYRIPKINAPTSYFYEVAKNVTATTSGTYYTESGGVYTAVTLPGAYVAGTTYYERYSGWKKGTIADHMGIPTKKSNFTVNALKLRAFAKVYNDWFRDVNVQKALQISKGETTLNGTNGNTYITDVQLGGMPPKVNKFHDLFTSCLPYPQRLANPVSLPLGTTAPVYPGAAIDTTLATQGILHWIDRTTKTQITGNHLIGLDQYGNTETTSTTGSWDHVAVPENLNADLRNATAATINQFREAMALETLAETWARYGNRYISILNGCFGVTPSNLSLHRSEYLGGKRIPITITPVAQTSSTDSTSPQGNLAAYSHTNINKGVGAQKSFQQHGYIVGVMCLRTEKSYQQGLEDEWSRDDKYSFYWNELANLGEQPILNKQIYLQGTSQDDEVFGYNEAWATYRFFNNYVTGEMRSNAENSLDIYHYADDYDTLPTLSADWMAEDEAVVDRTLAVPSTLADQFQVDIYFDIKAARELPMYSVPARLGRI